MSTKLISQAEQILEEATNELESSKGSVEVAVKKLLRASKMLDEKEIVDWCEIQLGNSEFLEELKELLKGFKESKGDKVINEIIMRLEAKGLKKELHFSYEDLEIKLNESSGGYRGIGFIEERYNDLVRLKKK